MTKFKGYAQATGFKNIQLPDTARRIREEGERTIRRMERNFDINQNNTRAVLEAFNDKYRIEQDNRDFVFELESENRNDIRNQMAENAKVLNKNNELRTSKTRATFEALAGLSATASKVSTELLTELDERGKEKGADLANIISLAGGSYADVEYMRKVEKAHIKNDERFNTILSKLIDGGAPNDIIEQVKNANSSTFHGLKKTMFVNAGLDYSNSLAASEAADLLNPDGSPTGLTLGQARAMGSQYRDAVEAQDLENRKNYVLKFGSTDDPMVAKYLFPKMLEAERVNERGRQAERLANFKTELKIIKQQEWADTLDGVEGGRLEGIAALWNRVQQYDDKGTAREEMLGALSQMANNGYFGTLEEGLQFFDDLVNYRVTIDGGKSYPKFGEIFNTSPNLRQLKSSIISSAERDDELNQKRKEADSKRRSLELNEWIYENSGSFDDRYVQRILSIAGKNSFITDDTKALLYQHSADAPTRQKTIQYLDDKIYDGTITLSDFSGIYDKVILERFEDVRTRLTNDLKDLRKKDADVKKDFVSELRTQLGYDKLADVPNNISLSFAADDLMRRYHKDMAIDRGGQITRDEQQEEVINKLIREIRQKDGRYAIKQAVENTPGKINVGTTYFINFDPSSKDYIEETLPTLLPRQVLANAQDNPNSVSTDKFISKGAATSYLKKIKNNRLQVIPPLFHQLSNVTGTPAHEIMAQQIALQIPEAKGITVNPDIHQNVRSAVKDRELIKLLTIPSSENLRTAQIAGNHKVHRVRIDEVGYYDVISLARSENFRAPHVVAALWANETSWGRNLSGKNNLFNIKSQDVTGTTTITKEYRDGEYVSEPAQWRDYDTPAQSVADFIQFISKYPGVAEANTPREMLQALQDGGYATNPNYADDISRVVEDFVNADMPFIQYDGPAATDPNYQSATLQHIYNTNTLGFGSTGPHTDVKQLDNLRTPENEQYTDFDPYDQEIGEYLLIDDNEYGEKVPIHRPGFSDGFQDHLNRGSHGGYDYLHHMNTPVYIKPPAKVVHSSRQDGTDILIVELPSGRRFQLIHGLRPSK